MLKIIENVSWLSEDTNSIYGPFLQIQDNLVVDDEGYFWVNPDGDPEGLLAECVASFDHQRVVELLNDN